MKNTEHKVREVLDGFLPGLGIPAPSPDQMDTASQRVLQRLRLEPRNRSEDTHVQPRSRPFWKLAAVAAVVLAIVTFILVSPGRGIAQISEGELYRVKGPRSALSAGDWIRDKELLRSTGNNGAVLAFADGSQIELRANSEMSVESTNGVSVHLNQGSVIVNAADQQAEHFYVHTRDITAGVTGTVFLVSAESTGSRVAVIDGQVQVQQGPTVKTLLPGQQVVTNPSLEAVTLAEELSWSRNAPALVAMLHQVVPVLPLPENPEFEVAAIRENRSGSGFTKSGSRNERVTITNYSLRQIILLAYEIKDYQLSGPSLLSERYDINAKAPSGTPDNELIPMLRSLLKSRFKMVIRREAKEVPIYALVVTKDGLKATKLEQSETISGFGPPTRSEGGPTLATMQSIGNAAGFANALSRHTGDRPVIDKTNLTDRYVFKLAYVPDRLLGTGVEGPSLFAALQEQLGLKLEPQTAPVEFFIVDSIEKPSEN